MKLAAERAAEVKKNIKNQAAVESMQDTLDRKLICYIAFIITGLFDRFKQGICEILPHYLSVTPIELSLYYEHNVSRCRQGSYRFLSSD